MKAVKQDCTHIYYDNGERVSLSDYRNGVRPKNRKEKASIPEVVEEDVRDND